jgi:hypothetical protein
VCSRYCIKRRWDGEDSSRATASASQQVLCDRWGAIYKKKRTNQMAYPHKVAPPGLERQSRRADTSIAQTESRAMDNIISAQPAISE